MTVTRLCSPYFTRIGRIWRECPRRGADRSCCLITTASSEAILTAEAKSLKQVAEMSMACAEFWSVCELNLAKLGPVMLLSRRNLRTCGWCRRCGCISPRYTRKCLVVSTIAWSNARRAELELFTPRPNRCRPLLRSRKCEPFWNAPHFVWINSLRTRFVMHFLILVIDIDYSTRQ